MIGHDTGRAHFLEAKLGVLVKITSPGDELIGRDRRLLAENGRLVP
jgi:hypothetical protein